VEPLSFFGYIYLGTGGYLINFLNVLPVSLPAAKATPCPINRTSEKPWRSGLRMIVGIIYHRGWEKLMSGIVPPTAEALKEVLSLSSEILRNIELSEIPLTNIALKTSRLACLLNDYDVQTIMGYEAGGYPDKPDGIPPDVWRLAVMAGRIYEIKDSETGEVEQYAWTQPITEWEQEVKTAGKELEAARDPDISISSANPYQSVSVPTDHRLERAAIRIKVGSASKRLAERRALIYRYVLRKNHESKFSGIADDIFSRIRERVDAGIGKAIPKSVQKLSAIHDNLRSENAEDWSNAVHSCRRILHDLADAVFPPQKEDRIKTTNGKKIPIKLGKGHYINRLIAFIEDHSSSNRYKHIVGSHLKFIGERLDSIVRAAQKGTHNEIVSPQEADRYVVYTYMIIGDILSLLEDTSEESTS